MPIATSPCGVAADKAPGNCTVREVMSERVYYCFDRMPSARPRRWPTKVRRLPILNRDKRLVGVVALADLARAGVETAAIEGVSEPTSAARA